MASLDLTYGVNVSTDTFPSTRDISDEESVDTQQQTLLTPVSSAQWLGSRRFHRHQPRQAESAAPTSSPLQSPQVADVGLSHLPMGTGQAAPDTSISTSVPASEAGWSYQTFQSSSTVVSVIQGPMTNTRNNYRIDEQIRRDSAFAHTVGLQQQWSFRGTNHPTALGRTIVEREYTSGGVIITVETRSTAVTAPESRTRVATLVRRLKEKMKPIRRFFQVSPIRRMQHNIEIGRYERARDN